jgi:hypothetical protein
VSFSLFFFLIWFSSFLFLFLFSFSFWIDFFFYFWPYYLVLFNFYIKIGLYSFSCYLFIFNYFSNWILFSILPLSIWFQIIFISDLILIFFLFGILFYCIFFKSHPISILMIWNLALLFVRVCLCYLNFTDFEG